jgi:probable addiction module antidote protein
LLGTDERQTLCQRPATTPAFFIWVFRMSEEVRAIPLGLTEATRHLNEAFDTSDIAAICIAIGEVAGLFNITDLARKAAVERSSLYRVFGGGQSPNLSTVLALLDAMNLQMKVVRRKKSPKAKVRKS